MKITFKDGTVVDKAISVSVSNIKRNGKYTAIINIIFDKSVGFSDLEDVMTQDNIGHITVETEKETDNVVRVYEDFNKMYMTENISDQNHQFVVSLEKGDGIEEDVDGLESEGSGEGEEVVDNSETNESGEEVTA